MNQQDAGTPSQTRPLLDRSFLLRTWRAGGTGSGGCRASLEDLETGERLGFASMEELLVFLMELSENEGKGEAQWINHLLPVSINR